MVQSLYVLSEIRTGVIEILEVLVQAHIFRICCKSGTKNDAVILTLNLDQRSNIRNVKFRQWFRDGNLRLHI